MTTTGLPDNEALLDLLVSSVTEGVTSDQEEQLHQQIRDYPSVDPDCFEHAAAAAAVVFCRRDTGRVRMPAALKQRILLQARSDPATPGGGDVVYLDQRRAPAQPETEPARRPWLSGQAVGWYAAAALALVLVLPRPETGTPLDQTLAEQRAALLATATDAITVPWTESEQAGYEQVAGDVVWSDATQQGFLRLVGLPTNQPTVAQYQLWIIDPDRDDVPVDGGVFDVTSDGQVLVPINAKLTVMDPKAFALTLEQPGGVVVSDGPLLVVAASASRPG